MPPFWAPFSPSSKSSSSLSTSPSDSPKKENSRRKHGGHRKSRHAGDDDLGLQPAKSLPASPDQGSASRSPHPWSRSAVPQPLPLPELSTLQKNNNSSDHFTSPKEGLSKGEGDRDHPISTLVSSNRIFQPTRRSSSDDVQRSFKSPTYLRRGFSYELHVEGIGYDFGHGLPARSAPNSRFSSPALSPQRFRTVDYASVQASFGLDSSPQDGFIGAPSQVLPTRTMCSPDHSPLQSPKSQNSPMNTRKHTSAPSHSCQKSHSEAWLENSSAVVHPLPLPPGVLRPSQPSVSHQYIDKSEVSPVKGQWKKGRLIGRGTYGSVYVATNCKTGALCAMKEVDLIPDDSKAMECIKQLEQEIKVLRQLKHPNVVQYLGSETIEDRFCIYLEYVHPGSINRFVNEHCGAMTECVVRSFTRHITSGLAYLHSKKTIHRDIKGANLLVDAKGVVKLADFGLAKHLTGCANDLSLKGSPHWMAPEVLQAAMRKDKTSELAFGVDIWSLGCTVIEMLTGKPPWSDFNGVQAMFNVLNKSPPIPDTLSPEGKDFLQLCFKRRPADRPSAATLLDHAFLRHPNEQEFASCLQEFSGATSSDKLRSPDCEKRKKDLMSFLPKIYTKSREQPYNSESRQTGPKVSDCGTSSRHSPRSTLEGLPIVSSPELNCSSNNAIPPNRNVFNSLLEGGAGNKKVSSDDSCHW